MWAEHSIPQWFIMGQGDTPFTHTLASEGILFVFKMSRSFPLRPTQTRHNYFKTIQKGSWNVFKTRFWFQDDLTTIRIMSVISFHIQPFWWNHTQETDWFTIFNFCTKGAFFFVQDLKSFGFITVPKPKSHLQHYNLEQIQQVMNNTTANMLAWMQLRGAISGLFYFIIIIITYILLDKNTLQLKRCPFYIFDPLCLYNK